MFQELGSTKPARSIWKSRAAGVVCAALLTPSFWMAVQAAEMSEPMSKQPPESMSAKGDARSMESMDMHKADVANIGLQWFDLDQAHRGAGR